MKISDLSYPTIKAFFNNKTSILLLLNHLLVLYAFFLPFNSDVRKSVFFTILVVWLLFYRNYRETIAFALQNKVIQAFGAIFLMYLLWLAGTDNWERASYYVQDAKVYLFSILIFAFAQYSFIKRILGAFFLGMLVNELTSYGIFFEILPAEWSYYDSALDPTPNEYSHLAYGLVLSFTTGMVLYHWLKDRELGGLGHWVLGLFFVSASTNIFITGGRIGYLLYAISMLTVVLYLYRHRIKSALAIMVIALALIYTAAYQWSSVVQERVNLAMVDMEKIIHQNNYTESFGIRIAVWTIAADVVEHHWLFGVGVGDHIDALRQTAEEKYPHFLFQVDHVRNNIHNFYLDILMQFGIVGLIAFGYLFYQIVQYDQPDKELKLAQLLLVVLVLIFGTIGVFSRNIPGVMFVSLIALSLVRPGENTVSIAPMTKSAFTAYLFGGIALSIIALTT